MIIRNVLPVVFSVLFLLPGEGFATNSHRLTNTPTINILWGNLSRPLTLNFVAQELARPIKAGGPLAVRTRVTDITNSPGMDPFLIRPSDFLVDHYLPYVGDIFSPPPSINPVDAAWFGNLHRTNSLPEVFVIAGHQVISEGWHNDPETKFIFLPSLLQTIATYPDAKAVFDHVKLPILWGCNAMTNLEPHGPHGEYMRPEQIKALYESGPAGKASVIGTADKVNTLEFYRARLAREYGPHGTHYEYTRDPKKEVCKGPGRYDNCDITNLDRILPDSGLWDGTHRYNYPYMMKRLFPNAQVILGFSSASPSEEERVKIFEWAVEKTYDDVNASFSGSRKKINNILYPLISDAAPVELKKEIVTALRRNWTLATDKFNRQRPAGSVTPLYPELDKSGILGAPLERGSNQYGAYEPR